MTIGRVMLMPTKIEEAFAHLGAILMQTAASDDKIIIGHVRDAHGLLQDALRAPSPRAPSEDDDWKDDPSADERWQAGLDFGLLELCAVLDVKPHDVTWDAATETLDGDVSAVIGNILRAKYGEDFDPTSPAPTAAPTLGREADCDCGAATSGKWSGIHSEGCSAMRETTGIDDVEWLDAKVVELSKENERLRAALTAPAAAPTLGREEFIRVLASLAAAISLLERGGKAAKKAAASDKIFDQMLVDYKAALEAGRATILARSVAESEKPLTVPSDLRATSAELRPCPHGMSTWQRCSQCNPD